MSPPQTLGARFAFSAVTLFASILGAMLSPSQAAAAWPEFRGPRGDGFVAPRADGKPLGLPLRWSEAENIAWKVETPGRGWSTPVILGNRIWITTATPDGHDFSAVCVDADSGELLLSRRLFHADNPEPLGNGVNCYASPSPAIEPGRVYVHFGSYGTACLNAETGKTLWERTDLPCRHYRGPGSSVVLYRDLLILTFDGVDVQYVAALDKMTGRTVWKTDRSTKWDDLDASGKPKREGDFRKAFSTPLVVETTAGAQVLSVGSKAAFSYDPRTGKELWSLRLPGYSCAPRPVFADGLAFVNTGRGKPGLWAVRVDARGALDDSHIAWRIEGKLVPDTPSPLLVDGLLYVLSDHGSLTCLEATTGKTVWSERISGSYMASPVCADGRIYCSSVQGKTTVIAAGRTYEVLAENTLGSGFMASPAVHGNALILRTKTHLYRVEEGGVR